MTIIIELPEDVAERLSGLPEAERQAFAVAALRAAAERCNVPLDRAPAAAPRTEPRNLAEFLGDFIGAVQSERAAETGGKEESVSRDEGSEAFVTYLENKRRAGRL